MGRGFGGFMSNSSGSKQASFPIIGLLGIVFVALKLCGVIGWSWWWVTAPFWGGLALAGAVLLVVFVASVIMAALE